MKRLGRSLVWARRSTRCWWLWATGVGLSETACSSVSCGSLLRKVRRSWGGYFDVRVWTAHGSTLRWLTGRARARVRGSRSSNPKDGYHGRAGLDKWDRRRARAATCASPALAKPEGGQADRRTCLELEGITFKYWDRMEAERACFHVRKTVVPKTTTKKILIEFLTLLV